jgi:hypothetical protein
MCNSCSSFEINLVTFHGPLELTPTYFFYISAGNDCNITAPFTFEVRFLTPCPNLRNFDIAKLK